MAGKTYRKGISFVDLIKMFPDDETAEKWFIEQRWGDEIVCPKCGSHNVQVRKSRKPQPYRCRSCRKDFSVKTDTLMHNSPLGFQVWAIAIYLSSTSIKGVSSMKLHRDLKITQKSAWHLAHRIRETWNDQQVVFAGPVEVDETYIGGKRKNMSNRKRKALKKAGAGRGADGKVAVAGIKDRGTRKIKAAKVENTTKKTLQGFIESATDEDATVYTDDHRAYLGMKRDHKAVKHSISEYVNGQAHSNGIESFWALLKRGYHGTYHHMSAKHLDRYVNEFSGRYNDRELDTEHQMELVAKRLEGKRLKYKDLVADHGAQS